MAKELTEQEMEIIKLKDDLEAAKEKLSNIEKLTEVVIINADTMVKNGMTLQHVTSLGVALSKLKNEIK